MEAKLYLAKMHQDMIDGVKNLEEFKRIGDAAAWTLCCDGFCCILDFSKVINRSDLVTRKQDWTSWYIRKEEFGALLWNPDTNRVFELDDEAYKTLMTLQEGTGLEKVTREYGVKAEAIFKLLAQISETPETRAA
ncbi:MAG: hypothetical protein ACOYYS_00535 [Chloroflexota bacterium]